MCTYLVISLVLGVPFAILPIGFNITGSIVLVALIFSTTVIVPVLNLYILKASGKISSISLTNRNERLAPVFYTLAMYVVTAYLFYQKVEMGNLLPNLISLSAGLIFMAMIITLFWKISLHAIAMGGFIGCYLGLNYLNIHYFEYTLATLFIATGLVVSARLKLQAHTPAQVYVGFLLGFFSSFVAINYFQF